MITVTIANIGYGRAKDIILREDMPSSVSTNSVKGATTYSSNYVMWRGELDRGELHSIDHRIKILEEKNKFFQAKVSYSDESGKKYESSATIYLIPKPETTPTPKPTSTPTPAGFEAIFPIMGLLAVAYILRRRK